MSDLPPIAPDGIPRPPGMRTGPVAGTDPLRRELAAAAARLVADGGLDYGSAKRRAAQEALGGRSVPRDALPDNGEIDEALREHLALFDDGHAARVTRMRRAALALMALLDDFTPYVTGGVWKGIVAEHTPIHLQLFHDDGKDVTFRLLDHGLDVDAAEVPHFRGDGGRATVEALTFIWRDEPVLLSLYAGDDLRGALRGTPAERGDAEGLRRLLAATPAEPT